MYYLFHTFFFFGFTVGYFGKALEIAGSSSHAVVSYPFTITCSGNSNNVIITLSSNSKGQIANFAGANLNNTCNLSGTPFPGFTFRCMNDSRTVTYGTIIPEDFITENLHLSNWTCRNPFTKQAISMILHVDVPVTSVTITPTTIDLPVTRNKTFTCKTTAIRPSARIQWFLSDGKNLTASATQQPDCIQVPKNKQICSSELTYVGSLMDHGKNIFCEASNLDGESKPSQNVSLYISYGPRSIVLFPATLSYTVTEKRDSVGPITCSADCRPNCTRTWNGTNLSGVTTSELNLKNITRNQAGDYYCTANNSVDANKSEAVHVIVKFGPYSVVLSPSNTSYIVTENTGRVGTINCTADCKPDCTLTWSGPNLPVGTTSELNLLSINRNQTGDYHCTANNSIGSIRSNAVKVIVNYGPSVVEVSPSNLLYTVNETSSIGPITCKAECRPNCTMLWSGPNLPDGTTSVLNIKNITRNNTGNYTCTASNGVAPDKSAIVKVIVNYGPNSVVLSPSTLSYTVTEGLGMVGPITCTADCRPDCTMTWSGPNLFSDTASVLNLQNINRTQTGNYSCTAQNDIKSKPSENVTVVVHYGPSIVMLSPSTQYYTVKEYTGSIAPITCTADCRPKCNMTWNGPNLPDDTTHVLNLQNISRNQTGDYWCTASNNVNSSNSKISAVTVLYPPGVEIKGNVSYSENDTAKLQCVADSFPPAEIKWHFIDLQNRHINKKLTRSKKINLNKTYIEIAQMSCLSMGTYVCQANNSVGVGKGFLNVTVTCAPRLNNFEFNITHSIGVKDNEPLNLTVPILSYPPPWIYWQMIVNDTFINITNGITNAYNINRHTSNVCIKNMTEDTFGSYAIYAGNGIGTGDYVIAVYNVQSSRRPNPPSNVTCQTGSSYIIVNWQPEFDGGSSQSFRVFYRSTEQSLFRPHSTNISEVNYQPAKIENLNPSTVYWLKIHAFNIHNFTASKVINCNTSTGDEPETNNIIAVGVGAGIGSAVLVLCVVFVVIFVLRRLKRMTTGNDKEPIRRSNDDDESDDLKVNPLYISSGDVVYSQPNRDTNKGKSNKQIEMGCVYENSDDFMGKNGEQIYANENTGERNAEPIKHNKNKDGLIYADLDLAPVAEERRFMIRGLENKSNYAIIDLGKKADPLPSDDEGELEKK